MREKWGEGRGDWCRAITVAEVQTSREFERRPVAVRASSTPRRACIVSRYTGGKDTSRSIVVVSESRGVVQTSFLSCLSRRFCAIDRGIAVWFFSPSNQSPHTLRIKKKEKETRSASTSPRDLKQLDNNAREGPSEKFTRE